MDANDIGSIIFFGLGGLGITFAMLYNHRHLKRLRRALDDWAAQEGLTLEQVKTLVVWRGIGQKYDRADGVYAVKARGADGRCERIRLCIPHAKLEEGAGAVEIETREEISHLDGA